MLPEIDANRLSELRRELLLDARKSGFRVAHRSEEFKHLEQEATCLCDRAVDSSTGLKTGQNVTVGGVYAPAVFGQYACYGNSMVSYGGLYKIVAFVEVPAKTGKLVFKHLYCALAVFNPHDANDKGALKKDREGKVLLFWIGSLQPLSWEVEKS